MPVIYAVTLPFGLLIVTSSSTFLFNSAWPMGESMLILGRERASPMTSR